MCLSIGNMMAVMLMAIFSLYSTDFIKGASAWEEAEADAGREALETYKQAVVAAEAGGLAGGCLEDAKSAATNMEATMDACLKDTDNPACETRIVSMSILVEALKSAFIDNCKAE